MVVERPRLTVVAHDLDGAGGMERALDELVVRAVGDFRVAVVSASLPNHLRPLVDWHRVRVPRGPAPLKVFAFFVRAGWTLRRLRSDVVHATGAIVPTRADVITVHYLHAARTATEVLDGLRDVGLARRLNALLQRFVALLFERWCYRPSRSLVLVAVSEGVAAEVRSHYPDVRVEVVANGVDQRQVDEVQADLLRRSLGLRPDQSVFLFVGGHWGHKGLGRIFRALALLPHDVRAGVRLLVVGSGDLGRFQDMAKELGVVDLVTFTGRADPTAYYWIADALVLPSTYETFSLVCHEAAAAGLCVIATAVHGVRELVTDGQTGLITSVDPVDIARCLRTVIDDPQSARTWGDAARARVAPLTWDSNYSGYTRFYRSALSTPDDPKDLQV